MKPGTRLLREWNGVVYAVLVADKSLIFQGRSYSSLSSIAKEITGAQWSGPRFFGLKRLIYASPDANPTQRDERLVGLIASGHAAWEELLKTAPRLSTTRRSHLTRLARLRFLAPDIVSAIVDGRQPVELTNRSLLRIAQLPLAWTEQRIALGFA